MILASLVESSSIVCQRHVVLPLPIAASPPLAYRGGDDDDDAGMSIDHITASVTPWSGRAWRGSPDFPNLDTWEDQH